jgi:hypothetical protein
MKLFGYLPESVFQPLSGQKKHVYARLLMRPYDRIFAPRFEPDRLFADDTFFPKEGVL